MLDLDLNHGPAWTRRDFIRIGSLSALGVSLPDWLRAQEDTRRSDRKDVACILLWLGGGPSHIDSFDPKPDAPAAVRGEFGSIPTSISGVRFIDLLPQLAGRLDKFSLIRSVTSPENGHERATHDLLSGYRFNPAIEYPAYGSVVARELGDNGEIPASVLLGGFPFGYGGAGYMGARYNPFNVDTDPNKKNFRVRDVSLPGGLTAARLDRRRSILADVDAFRREVDASEVSDLDAFYQKAYALITSPAARRAFELESEPEHIRSRFGRSRFGQSCLLARRLVESGARFVTVNYGGWDTHQNNFKSLRTKLPDVDRAYSALLDDLAQRGLLDSTLVICMGEFGRTPKVNPSAGRDHWGRAMSVTLGGGGVKCGQVIGATNANAEEPTDRPVTVPDLAATIYEALGIDRHKVYVTPQNRPLLVNYGGEPVHELF